MWRCVVLALVVQLLAACGESLPDPVDAGTPPGNAHYVVDTLLVPLTAGQATMSGVDLDGQYPPRSDNALGAFLANLAGLDNLDVQAIVDGAIASGDALILFAAHADDFNDTNAAAWRVLIADPPAMPPLFDGTDALAVDQASAPPDATMFGTFRVGHFSGGPAHAPITIRLAFAGGAPIDLHLVGARIEADVRTNGCQGRLGGAITNAEVGNTILPALAKIMNDVVASDPGCHAEPPRCGNTAQNVLIFFDRGIKCSAASECPPAVGICDVGGTNQCTCGHADCWGNLAHDGEITAAELQSLQNTPPGFLALSLMSDVDLLDPNGVFQEDPTNRDGFSDSLSFGVSFTCVPALFDVAGEPP